MGRAERRQNPEYRDYETVVSWIAERAPTEVYAALVRLRLNDTVSETQKRMGEVIRQDSEDIAVLRAELEQAHNDYVDAQREVERLRAALEIIAGPGESDVYIAAGGGYEGLQAIARDALAGT